MEKSSCPGPTRIKLFLSVHSRGLSQRDVEYLLLEGALGSLGALSRIVVSWWALRYVFQSLNLYRSTILQMSTTLTSDLSVVPSLSNDKPSMSVKKEDAMDHEHVVNVIRGRQLLPRLCYSWKDFGSVKILLDYTKKVFGRGRSSAPARCAAAFLWKDVV